MRIRVATLNVWGLPEPLAPDGAARMREIGRRLPPLDLDVIAFQEVWTGEVRDLLIAAGRGAGLAHVWHGRDLLGSGGLLVLSRLPISDVTFEAFALRGHVEQITNGEYLSGKGFARVVLETPEGPITLINTHLHARYGGRVSHGFAAHRTGQIVQLAGAMAPDTGPIVVLGDFNLSEDAPEYDVLRGLTSVRDAAVEAGQRTATVVAGSPYRKRRRRSVRKDYIFVRDGQEQGLAVKRLEQAFARTFEIDGREAACSNHAGVVAELELAPASRSVPAFARPAREVVEMASRLLEAGRTDAEMRRHGGRTLSGVGAGIGVVSFAAASLPDRPVGRRAFLRGSLRSAALLALAPAVGYALVSEVVVPDEIHAFRDAAARLARLAHTRSSDGLMEKERQT